MATFHRLTEEEVQHMIKKVVVTGGGGYVGRVLISKLVDSGYHVKGLDLYIYGGDVVDA